MTASEIINQVARDPEYKTICRKFVSSDLYEDLFQELIIILLEKPSDKIEEVYRTGGIKWFIIRILQNQTRSNGGFFRENILLSQQNREIFESDAIATEQEEDDKYYQQIVEFERNKQVFETSSEWYENELFFIYLEEQSYRAVERATGISRQAVQRSVEGYINKLKTMAEQKKQFMETTYFKVELNNEVKEHIFTNSLYCNLTPEDLINQQMKIINRAMKIKNQAKHKPKNTQLLIF